MVVGFSGDAAVRSPVYVRRGHFAVLPVMRCLGIHELLGGYAAHLG